MRRPTSAMAAQGTPSRGLTFDAAVFHHQMPEISALADAFPDTPIVLNHLGQAVLMDLDAHGRAPGVRGMRAIAE